MCPQRATAGLRRTTAELTDGNLDNGSSSNSNPVNESPTPIQPADPVTMEISSSPPLTDLERENLVSWRSQEVEELHYPEVHGVQRFYTPHLISVSAAPSSKECLFSVYKDDMSWLPTATLNTIYMPT